MGWTWVAAPSLKCAVRKAEPTTLHNKKTSGRTSKPTLPLDVMAVRPREAARILNVSLRIIWKWINQGRLDTAKPSPGITLILMDSIRRLLSE
jgi:hypothetical protein